MTSMGYSDELRQALMAFLTVGEAPIEVFHPMVERVDAALKAPHTVEELDALIAEFRAEAIRTGQHKLAWSPLYPWGIVHHVVALRDRLRYEAAGHQGPCNCKLVTELDLPGQLQTGSLVKIGESDDYYDRWEEFRCPACGAIWRQLDASTEQYSAWHWTLTRAGDGW